MGSGQSIAGPSEHTLVLQLDSDEQRRNDENKKSTNGSNRSRQKNKVNKPLSNKYGGMYSINYSIFSLILIFLEYLLGY